MSTRESPSMRDQLVSSPLLCLFVAVLALLVPSANAAPPSPREHFGFAIGDDYQLATYTQTERYFRRVAETSERMQLVEIGKTSEGRSQLMLIASSPANLAKLDEYRQISARLAYARDDEATARQLAATGKAVVWIDGGLHADETVGTHQLIETVWQLASRSDEETLRILEDTIVLLVHANPDGQELISSWYMREPDPEKRLIGQPNDAPRLYHYYVGHDNNRDFYMAALSETRNMNRIAYTQWYPQILYNHHQPAPRGTVIVIPPYRDPFNYNLDAMVPVGLEALGAAMNGRFLQEGKPGAVSKRGSVFSTWWNGGLRTTPYFHNILGVLTEIFGNPTPQEMPFLVSRQLPDSNLPAPVPSGRWHFRQSIEYSLTANWALLDYASRHREQLLFNFWRMGRNSIERGSRDYWTPSPSALAAIDAGSEQDPAYVVTVDKPLDAAAQARLYAPERRDPRVYILPSDQADFPTAVKFINALQLTGIEVHRAARAFNVNGKRYPAGSFVVRTAQAFRPHVIDMFEPQDHPHDFAYEGGPPIAPYDSAGWTLAFQMGVKFDRILDAVESSFTDGTLVQLPIGEVQSPPLAQVPNSRIGWAVAADANDAFTVVNALLKAGTLVQRDGAGRFVVPASSGAQEVLNAAVARTGVRPEALRSLPSGLRPVRAPRIALWDQYGGSMVSGWTRLVLENFGFDYTVVFPQQITAGNLRDNFDVLILPSGALAMAKELAVEREGGWPGPRVPDKERIPAEYQHMLGNLNNPEALSALRVFLERGGHIVATGSSSSLAVSLGLPVKSHLVTEDGNGGRRALRSQEYYIPGSVLQVAVDPARPAARGLNQRLDLYFSDGRWDNAPVFDLPAGDPRLRPILWFDTDTPLRSGWAWGQHVLKDGVLAAEAEVGSGRLTFFGTDITFRSQTHGAFKLMFNSLIEAGTE